MRLATVAAMAAVVVALAGASSAGSSTAPSATIENIATVVLTNVTNFEFNLYDCPFGEDMTVVAWDAQQPARPGNDAAAALVPFGTSSGAHTQHLTLSAGSNFVAGSGRSAARSCSSNSASGCLPVVPWRRVPAISRTQRANSGRTASASWPSRPRKKLPCRCSCPGSTSGLIVWVHVSGSNEVNQLPVLPLLVQTIPAARLSYSRQI